MGSDLTDGFDPWPLGSTRDLPDSARLAVERARMRRDALVHFDRQLAVLQVAKECGLSGDVCRGLRPAPAHAPRAGDLVHVEKEDVRHVGTTVWTVRIDGIYLGVAMWTETDGEPRLWVFADGEPHFIGLRYVRRIVVLSRAADSREGEGET